MFLPELCLKLMVNLYYSHVAMNESLIGIHKSQTSVARQQLFLSVKAQFDSFLWTAVEETR